MYGTVCESSSIEIVLAVVGAIFAIVFAVVRPRFETLVIGTFYKLTGEGADDDVPKKFLAYT